MRTSRFFTEQTLTPGDTVTLDEETSHYLLRVLRMRSGQPLLLFNGDGKDYRAVVEGTIGRLAVARVSEGRETNRESALRIELGQGVSRGERMDFVLQKSVELGVSSITPLWTTRSQIKLNGARLEKRMKHWRAVVRSACEQSGRTVVPSLRNAGILGDWCSAASAQLNIVLDPAAGSHMGELPSPRSVRILIGPEGGLEEKEIQLAEMNGFKRVRLGPRTLRTETAALAALTAVQVLWGDLAT